MGLVNLVRAGVERRLQMAQAAKAANVNGTWSATAAGATQADVDAAARYWEAETNPASTIRHCVRDLSVLERHVRDEHGYCFWCSEDGREPINVAWPCHEILDLVAAYGVEQ